MSFGLKTTVAMVLPFLLGGGSSPEGPPPGHPEYNKAVRGGGFLDFVKGGARAFSDSKKGQPIFGTTELPKRKTIKELTRGQTAQGGLSPPVQQLYQKAAVMEAARHLRENGSRDINLQSMMNDLGYVRPTSPQGKKTVVTERPELSEINVG